MRRPAHRVPAPGFPAAGLSGPGLSGPGFPAAGLSAAGSHCLGRLSGAETPARARRVAAHLGPRCSACGSGSVTSIAMRLTDGSPVQFTSCRRCEHRRWVQDDRPLAFETVLAKTRKPR